MNDIIKFEPSYPVYNSFQEEKEKIVSWLSVGIGTKEVALFMIYRIWRDSLYIGQTTQDFTLSELNSTYIAFGDFLKEVIEAVDISRSTVYSRIKTYGLLEWLGYVEQHAIRMMATRPSLYEKVLSAIFSWDQEARVPSAVKTAEFGEITSPTFKEEVRKFINSLESFDSIKDAVDHLKSDLMKEPTIRIRLESVNSLVVSYETSDYDADTGESFVSNNSVVFYSDKLLPGWVVDAFKTKQIVG